MGPAAAIVAKPLLEQQPFRQPMPIQSVQRLDTVDAIVAAVDQIGGSPMATGFQSRPWLDAVYRHLVPNGQGRPLGILATDTGGGRVLFALYVRRVGGTHLARFADCGVSDYNSPLGQTGADAASLIAAMTPALQGVDALMLERMPPSRTALSEHRFATLSRLQSNVVVVSEGVDALVRSRGKKFRKEVERCYRVLQSHGEWTFARAQTPAEIEHAFATLERQQGQRHADKGTGYELASARYADFYQAILSDPSGFASIFTLSVAGETIAVVLGIVHGDTFTLLRIANGGEVWKQVSPGRLIVIETMHYFQERGVTTFDMGMGDYAFKRGFGAASGPLVDLVLPLTIRGTLFAGHFHLKARLRQNERLRTFVRRVRGG